MKGEPGFVVAIPARYGSTRLAGKPLLDIAGRPMIARVVERALRAGAREVVVATDDTRIADALAGESIEVCMTSAAHLSGTDRLAECALKLGWDDDTVVVNVQGDEPLVPEQAIRTLAEWLVQSGAPMATYAVPFDDTATLFDPNCVKVVADRRGRALLFSRSPIPWFRDRFNRDRVSVLSQRAWRHVGMYAYRAAALREFAAMPPGRLEQVEALEQLRALEAGWHIAVTAAPVPIPAGVDTAEDLERVRRMFREVGTP